MKRIAAGYAVLLFFYQLPQAVHDYVVPSRLLWLAATALFFVVARAVARRLGGEGLSSYALAGHTRWRRDLAAGLFAGLFFSAAAGAVSHQLGFYRIDAVVPLRALLVPAILLALGSALASLSEDILTRGFPWWQAGRRMPAARFCAMSAALYVANHIYVLNRGPALWTFLFVFGLGLAYAVHRTGSLWLAFGAHWGWNLVYHVSNAALTTTNLAPGPANTWVSAVASVALAGLLVWLSRRLSQRPGLVQ